MKYGVAVVCFNPASSVLNCIEIYKSIFEYCIIIDNSDTNNDIINIMKNDEKVMYKSLNGNKGISIALNYAFKYADELGLDYLLTMDQDSEYSLENILKMIEYIEKDDSNDVGIYVANYSKKYWNKKSELFVVGSPVISFDEVKEVDFCLTSSSFVRVEYVKDLLPMDDFFVSYVDNNLSTELRIRGYRLIQVGFSHFAQQVGDVVEDTWYNKTMRILHHSNVRYYYMVRNNFHYRKKYYQNKIYRKDSYYRLLRYLFNIVFGERNKINKIYAAYLGYLDYRKSIWGKIPDTTLIKLESRR